IVRFVRKLSIMSPLYPAGFFFGDADMADDDLKAEVERLRAENDRLKNRQTRGVSLKVSEKGGVSVYGLGRFPVTLYKEQWIKLLDMADDIRAFIKENESTLKTKADSTPTPESRTRPRNVPQMATP